MTRTLALIALGCAALAFAATAVADNGHGKHHKKTTVCFVNGNNEVVVSQIDKHAVPAFLKAHETGQVGDGCVPVEDPPVCDDTITEGCVPPPVVPPVEPPVVKLPEPSNAIASCYSHFQTDPVMIIFPEFKYLTTAPQPELGGKPYWTTGFQASVLVKDGKPVGFTCLSGTATGTWYDTSFFPQDHTQFVSVWGLHTVDQFGAAAIENYSGVTIP